MKKLISTFLLLFAVLTVKAQSVVSGKVTDQQGQPLAYVSVSAEGSKAHTVTNDDGQFTLKTTHKPRYVRLSHIGYKSRKVAIGEGTKQSLRIRMVSNTVELREVLVSANEPMAILRAAMERVMQNYPHEPELVRCFYRETARRGSRFISVAEAVTEMYKSDYAYGPERDAVAIMKGRRLMSMKARDTLGVKVQGGPVLPLMVDVAKNPDYLMNEENLAHYKLRMEVPVRIADRPQFVISMEPQGRQLYPLMMGRVFIDQELLAFTRAELQLDMTDWRQASEYMLVRKPMGLRFRPKELTVTIVYETDEQGITRMSYVRNLMRFNCDWKRRLFASPFITVCEMVVTDRQQRGDKVKRPRGRSSFGLKERFYDRVEYFDDPDFWADYNIIEPTESLENAIDKLKKKVRKN
ncbi:MAG: carboxypeptidase-like regulatory domain-containing protein [Prevotella sp.]|nr:carboxypeptidase-like regulatory domain-containing protein [Prevotella sp.]